MKKLVSILVFHILFLCTTNGQSFDVDVFEDNKAKFRITNYSVASDVEPIVVDVSFMKSDSFYIFKIDEMTEVYPNIYPTAILKKIDASFIIGDNNEIIIVGNASLDNLEKLLIDNFKERYSLSDIDEMDGYQTLFLNPAVMFDGYFKPYLNIFKNYIGKTIKPSKEIIMFPSFSDSIPSDLSIRCKIMKDSLFVEHELFQDEKKVKDFLFEKRNFPESFRDNMPFLETYYLYKSKFFQKKKTYILDYILIEKKTQGVLSYSKIQRIN